MFLSATAILHSSFLAQRLFYFLIQDENRQTTSLLDHESYSYDNCYRFEFRKCLFKILWIQKTARKKAHKNAPLKNIVIKNY